MSGADFIATTRALAQKLGVRLRFPVYVPFLSAPFLPRGSLFSFPWGPSQPTINFFCLLRHRDSPVIGAIPWIQLGVVARFCERTCRYACVVTDRILSRALYARTRAHVCDVGAQTSVPTGLLEAERAFGGAMFAAAAAVAAATSFLRGGSSIREITARRVEIRGKPRNLAPRPLWKRVSFSLSFLGVSSRKMAILGELFC